MISLGIDPSWSHTGLALVRWEPVRGLVEVLATKLSAPLNRDDVERWLESHNRIAILDTACIESAYVGKNKANALNLAESGGFCYYGLRGFNPDVVVHWMQAVEWRRLVFGAEYAGMKTDQAKKHAKDWLYAHPGIPEGLDEHSVEAVAIACAACVKETNK